MARGVNKVFLVGNLGHDPEPRQTGNGNTVVNFNLATDESYKDRQTGQLVPKTEWHRVVMFGKIAEIAGQYLRKGSKVYIEGKLQTRKWQGQDGQDRYTTEILVDINGQMQMLDSPPQNAGTGYQQPQQQPSHHQQPGTPGAGRPQSSYADAKAGRTPPPQQSPTHHQPPAGDSGDWSNGAGAPPAATGPGGGPVQDDDIPFNKLHWLWGA